MNLKELMQYKEVFMSFPDVVEAALMTNAEKVNHKLINEIEFQLIGRNLQCHDILYEIVLDCQKRLYEQKRKRNLYLVEGRCMAVLTRYRDESIEISDKISLIEDNQSMIEYQITRLGMDKIFLDYVEDLSICLCQEVIKQKPQLLDLRANSFYVESVIRLLIKKYEEAFISGAQKEVEEKFLKPYSLITTQLINLLQEKENMVFRPHYK